MKYLIILAILYTNIFAQITNKMYDLYQMHRYTKACNIGLANLYKNRNDTNFISIYAFSCLHANHLDRLSYPIARLKKNKSARANAAYLSVIVMQEKLLLHSMLDRYKLNQFKFPSTNYILSKVFNLYLKLKTYKTVPIYLFQDPKNKHIAYKLYITKFKQLVIEKFYDSTLVQKHVYN